MSPALLQYYNQLSNHNLHSRCAKKIMVPWITHAVLTTQRGPHYSFILHNPPKKASKIPITQSYLLSFHGVFIQGLCQNLTIHCRTMQHNPDPLDPCRAPAPELEHINSSNTTMGHFIWIFASSDWTGQGSHDPKTECAALPT